MKSEIQKLNENAKNGTGVRSDFLYSTLLGQKRYIFALQYIREANVLDCASGNGWGSYLMGSAGAKHVTGLELSEAGFSCASHYYSRENVSFVKGALGEVDFGEKKFDVVVSFETIEHVENPVDFLVNLRKLVHSEGVGILSTPNGTACKKVGGIPYNPYHFNEYSSVEMRDMFAKAGWSVLEYRGQYAMKTQDELKRYEQFLRTYWVQQSRVARYGLFARMYYYIILRMRPMAEPAYSCDCTPKIIESSEEPAYHYFVIKPV